MGPYNRGEDDVKCCIVLGIQLEKASNLRGAVRTLVEAPACASRWDIADAASTTVRACFDAGAARPATIRDGGAASHIQSAASFVQSARDRKALGFV